MGGQTAQQRDGKAAPPGSGFPVELAVSIHDGTAFMFASQDPAGMAAAEPADRSLYIPRRHKGSAVRAGLASRPCQVGGFPRPGQAANRG